MSHSQTVGLSINTATTRRQWTLPEAADNYARLGVSGIAPWRDQIAACGGIKSAARAVRESGLAVTGLCRGGMFPAADRAGIDAAHEENRRAVEEAHELDAACLVLVCGGLAAGSRDIAGARKMVADGIARLLPEARQAGVKLAIEPLHPMYAADRNCVNTLGQALDLCEQLDPDPGALPLGVALDVYHVWWDPRLAADIARLPLERLHAFHICDWRVPTRDLLVDRGMMGDGVIDLEEIAGMVAARGFAGLPEVEIFSDELWNRDPVDLVETCLDRSAGVRATLQQGSEGKGLE